MIGGGDHDHITGQGIDLQQQGADDALNFSGFVNVATLLTESVELIKEEDAWMRPDEIEEASKARAGLAQIASNDCFVSDGEEWQR